MENVVILVGEVVRVGKIVATASETSSLEFIIRTWREYEGIEYNEYNTCAVFGKNTSKFSSEIGIGTIVSCRGELTHRIWTDSEDVKRKATTVRIDRVKVLPGIAAKSQAKKEETNE